VTIAAPHFIVLSIQGECYMGVLKIIWTMSHPGMFIYEIMASALVLLMASRTFNIFYSSQIRMKSPVVLQLSCYFIMAIQAALYDSASIVASVAAEFPRDLLMGGGKPSRGWIELDKVPAPYDKETHCNHQENNNCCRCLVDTRNL
jgi:hypothetical protein